MAGIRIYEVKPLLVVSGAEVSLMMVPNYSRPYALKFSTFLAKHDFEATFQNGFLASIKSNQDTTAVALALIKLVEEATKAGGGGKAFADRGGGTGDRFGIYDFVFDDNGNIAGLRPLVSDKTLMKVPASAPVVVPPDVPGSGGGTGEPIRVN
ncbi:hypothetical protein [Aminobacter sp. HY435]|uniref:hypothetical protein n=1 Tax=Aminobacter sp. HY435 TaxID=2970917 RepID=UPI0022B9A9EA|nr:hypothetical protein [Aminobacter sp. HY435]